MNKSVFRINTSIGRVLLEYTGLKTQKIKVVLGKKQGLNSVNRNRIRRIVKEAARLLLKNLPENVEIIVFPKPNIFGLKSPKIYEILADALLREEI